jgi:hypothetical protein
MSESVKMNPAVKLLWVAALRSGLYKQGRHYLRIKKKEDITWCCLGVLCDIQQPGIFDQVDPNAGNAEFPYTLVTEKLPERLAAGLIYEQTLKLARMNDVEGVGFPEIADFIDANY